MLHFQPITALNGPVEAVLRAALQAADRDVNGSLIAVRAGLAAGEMQAAVLTKDGAPLGLALWRWEDPACQYAAVDWLIVADGAPPASGEALVAGVWDALHAAAAPAMIAARVRADPPGVRDALARREAVVFERHFMLCSLRDALPAAKALPAGYQIVPWEDAHQAAVEAVAEGSLAGSIDAVVLADAQPGRMGLTLRQIRDGQNPEAGPWNAAASWVALAPEKTVAGYVGTIDLGTMGFVVDIAVAPDHRRRGLARALLQRCQATCQTQGRTGVGLVVTAGNPAQSLYESLGFRTLDVGETAVWWADGRQTTWKSE